MALRRYRLSNFRDVNMTSLLLVNGPNLNMLGTRQPEIYGHLTLDDIVADIAEYAAEKGADLLAFQSNVEGELIEIIQQSVGRHDAVILNAGAYTHTSIALMDAIRAAGVPVVEVHMSNIHAREDYRHTSYIAPVAIGLICGFGAFGYRMAVDAALDHIGKS